MAAKWIAQRGSIRTRLPSATSRGSLMLGKPYLFKYLSTSSFRNCASLSSKDISLQDKSDACLSSVARPMATRLKEVRFSPDPGNSTSPLDFQGCLSQKKQMKMNEGIEVFWAIRLRWTLQHLLVLKDDIRVHTDHTDHTVPDAEPHHSIRPGADLCHAGQTSRLECGEFWPRNTVADPMQRQLPGSRWLREQKAQ